MRGDLRGRIDAADTRRIIGFAVAIALLAFAVLVWPIPAPLGVIVNGVLVGGRVALIALGIALVYRANRVVNFAQGDLGAVPASLAVLLIVSTGLNYILGFTIGLATAIVLGVLVETLIIRRFFRAPRLILTVATIGLAQVLVAAGLFLPSWFGTDTLTRSIEPPFTMRLTIGGTIFNANDLITMIVVPMVFVALGLFLHRSNIGIAVRAAAERADRAFTLGIPVKRLHTSVWVIATVLAYIAMFLRAGAVGLPIGSVLGPSFLLQALAAAVIGRMERLPTIACAAIGLGVIDQAMTFQPGNRPPFNDAVLFVIILVALLVTQRPSANRVDADSVSTWQAAREVRPIPRELARLPEVRGARWGLGILIVGVLLTLPLWLSERQVNLASVIVIFGIVGISLVVLTGWAGQVSLGQMAFVGIGAAVGGAITANEGWDLAIALLVGGAAGALIAVVIGFPSLRRRGLMLAVTTLAFALVTWSYILNREFFGGWLPPQRLERPALFGAIDISGETAYYFLCLAGLAIALVLVHGLRHGRTGRVLIGIRENERAARSYGVNASRTKLAAFAISGFLAAFAGVLLVHHQTGLLISAFAPQESLRVFSMVVIGGLGSIPGALIGAFYVRGTQYFLPVEWQFLATGVGLLLVLMIFPGGIGAALYDLRDAFLRRVARRRDLLVPSLVTDHPASPDLRSWCSSRTMRPRSAPTHEAVRGAAGEGSLEKLLVIRGVDVRYDQVQVLFNVDLEIDEGEIVALLGTNSSGKSTLINAISGLVEPSGGAIVFDGRDTTHLPPDKIAGLGVTQVPGGQGVFPSLTVAENLQLAAWLHRKDRVRVRDATDRVLETFPALGDRLDDPAGTLSGGQQQMLTLGMAFIGKPRLLMIDELSLGLAPSVVDQLLEIVRAFRDDGTTIILVEQSVNVALTVAETAYFMEKGEIRFHGPTAELLERPDILRSVFLEGAATHTDATAAPGSPRTTARTVVVHDAVEDEPRLVVDGVSKRFGGIDALVDVGFAVAPGEILGLIGANGAGKTTLFDVISGFLPPDAGSMQLIVDGELRDITGSSPQARARFGLGRSFQDGRLFPALTVAETIAVALDAHVDVRDPFSAALHLPAVIESEAKVAARVEELIELLGLGALHDKFVRELSTGSRRIVDLACVLAHQPTVLLLDEPSSGIAQREAEALGPLLVRIRDDLDASVLVIEHDLPLLTSIADRMVALDLGAVIADGPCDTVIHDPQVVASYLGDNAATIARSGPGTPCT